MNQYTYMMYLYFNFLFFSMTTDRTGNSNSIYKTLWASNHTDKEREEHDYYATDPIAIDILMDVEELNNVREPACWAGHMSKRMIEKWVTVYSTDLIDRWYGVANVDFLKQPCMHFWNGDIVTNPPYKYAEEFIRKAIELGTGKVCMFLKIQFMEWKKRKKLFQDHPPKTIYVSSGRIMCAKNGEFEKMKAGGGSAVAYAWYVREVWFTGNTIIKWVN